MKKVEIRVRPVTRYVVTRYSEECDASGQIVGAGCSSIGEFCNEHSAERMAAALRAFENTPECARMDEAQLKDELSKLVG